MRAALPFVVGLVFTMMSLGIAQETDSISDLPPGPGHDVTAQVCLVCHAANIITRRHLSAADWKDMVDVMVNQGAVADEKQKAEIVNYLSRTLPPVTAMPGHESPVSPSR